MIKNTRLALSLFLAAAMVTLAVYAGCGKDDTNPLEGTEWRLVALGDAQSPAEALGNPTARFTTAVDMTGDTGCNAYAARYTVDGSTLRLDYLTWTEAGCPSDALFRQEQRMQGLLLTVVRFAFVNEGLTLYSQSDQVMLFECIDCTDWKRSGA